jgi:hypothetical protein
MSYGKAYVKMLKLNFMILGAMVVIGFLMEKFQKSESPE